MHAWSPWSRVFRSELAFHYLSIACAFLGFVCASPSSPNQYKATVVYQGPLRQPDGVVSGTLCRVHSGVVVLQGPSGWLVAMGFRGEDRGVYLRTLFYCDDYHHLFCAGKMDVPQ